MDEALQLALRQLDRADINPFYDGVRNDGRRVVDLRTLCGVRIQDSDIEGLCGGEWIYLNRAPAGRTLEEEFAIVQRRWQAARLRQPLGG